MLRQTIADKCEVYGDYSEQVSDTYKLIASVHLSQGNIEKSLRAYNKVRIDTIFRFKNWDIRGLAGSFLGADFLLPNSQF